MADQLKKEIENIDFDLSELTSLEVLAKRPKVKALLATEMTQLKQLKSQLLNKLKEQNSGQSSEAARSGDSAAGGQPLGTVVVTNYMWDQTNDFIKVYIEIEKNYSLDSTQIQMNFPNKKSFSIVFGKFRFSISKLFDDIDADKSYHKLTKSGKLIIYLKKNSPKNWSSINHVENQFKKSMEEQKEDMSADPSAGLMKLMKQMYDEGDDEMKRSIAKSWFESQQKKNSNEIDMTDDFKV